MDSVLPCYSQTQHELGAVILHYTNWSWSWGEQISACRKLVCIEKSSNVHNTLISACTYLIMLQVDWHW